MPITRKRRKSPPRIVVAQARPIPVEKKVEYFPPERNYDLEEPKPKVRKNRRRKMGEAKDIVGETPKTKARTKPDLPEEAHSFKSRRVRYLPQRASGSGVLGDLVGITDRLDRAIEVKTVDLDNEPTQIAENHVKLGLLRGASSLVRRAKAMLEDYGKDLSDDMDPDFDAEEN